MTLRMILSFVIAFAAAFIAGKIVIPILVKMKVGQSIKEIGPTWHLNKQGTPTMGGVIFIAGLFVAMITAGMPAILRGELTHVFVFLFALVYGAIGFVDDYCKLKKKENTGLTGWQKLLLQVVAAVLFVLAMRLTGIAQAELYVPFFQVTVAIPVPVYYIFAVFVIVGCVNAVNLTDGIDGLATGVSLPVTIFYTVMAAIWGYEAQGLFAAALTGGLAAFLCFNFHPARVFMGDTGSLFLGGAVCALAFAFNMPLILVPLGIVYICEALSDIIQVGYFKLSHGKRVFKMAPIHHHFEMCGWSEYKVFAVFTAVSLVFAVLSWVGVKGRF
ncbi:MAG: phospho-N-acetylmuramoyl-pentapeptide-transferase [Oscillospiraceae bacterium]|nr:phospho-N-acetylmuramoyl-pentapeptide-transferase [Oscillospiraceae bacterium]